MASFGEMLAQAAKIAGGVVDIVDARQSAKKQQTLEGELATMRAETDRYRAEAEANAQALALQNAGDTQANLQKWLGWSLAALAVLAVSVGFGRMFAKRRG